MLSEFSVGTGDTAWVSSNQMYSSNCRGQAGLEIMAHEFGFGPIDHADCTLEARSLQFVAQRRFYRIFRGAAWFYGDVVFWRKLQLYGRARRLTWIAAIVARGGRARTCCARMCPRAAAADLRWSPALGR